jgi:GNAT superfamily N-acetyltransferase
MNDKEASVIHSLIFAGYPTQATTLLAGILERLKVKRKWWDLLNLKLRRAIRDELQKIYEGLVFRHPLIDNSKNKVTVSLPLVGYNFFVDVWLYDKKGNLIIDLEHPSNLANDVLEVQYQLIRGKWNVYYHTLFLKHEFQGKGIGKAIGQALNSASRQLQDSKRAHIQATDVGRYAFSRIPGVVFYNKRTNNAVEQGYLKWLTHQNKPSVPVEHRVPSSYPKEYLLSHDAPEFIDYLVPIRDYTRSFKMNDKEAEVVTRLTLLGHVDEALFLLERIAGDDSFKPPADVRKAAKKGLELRKKFQRGGLSTQEAGKEGIGSGIARASNLANGDNVSYDTVKRMKAFFDRHQGNKKTEGWGSESKPSNGWIAWLLWGGDAGWAWAKKIVKEQEKDEASED